MVKTRILLAGAALMAALSAVAEAKLFKWVDKDGVTHYGEVVPPEYADREQKQIEKGMEVKKQEKPGAAQAARPVQETPEQIEQRRRDEALLGTFTSEEEIDQARDRNLQQVNARTSGLEMRIKSAQDDLNGYEKEKAALQAAGKPVDKGLQTEIEQATAKLAKLQEERTKNDAETQAIRARYEADKQRFRELKSKQQK